MMRLLVSTALSGLLVAPAVWASLQGQTPTSIDIHVRETAGIRRFNFPVDVRVPFPQGALSDTSHIRLVSARTSVPAQFTVESAWPDRSIQWLVVDFNSSPGPAEELTLQLEYGEGVTSPPVARGVTVDEESEAVQISAAGGTIRFNKNPSPLIASLTYRGELITRGVNGITITDSSGAVHDLSRVSGLQTEVLKRGPIKALLRYTGRIPLDPTYAVPVDMSIEMPNSKGWFKVSATVDDPQKRVREIAFHTPFQFGHLPWAWDFGTNRWTYGVLRNPSDAVTLTQTVTVPPGKAAWQVRTTANGQEQLYEASTERRNVAAGWAHIQDAKDVVAFAVEQFGLGAGTYRASFEGSGQTSIRFAPAQPATRHQLTVFAHFVQTPVHLGAATSPNAMLNPLVATLEREQYVRSGVRLPLRGGR